MRTRRDARRYVEVVVNYCAYEEVAAAPKSWDRNDHMLTEPHLGTTAVAPA